MIGQQVDGSTKERPELGRRDGNKEEEEVDLPVSTRKAPSRTLFLVCNNFLFLAERGRNWRDRSKSENQILGDYGMEEWRDTKMADEDYSSMPSLMPPQEAFNGGVSSHPSSFLLILLLFHLFSVALREKFKGDKLQTFKFTFHLGHLFAFEKGFGVEGKVLKFTLLCFPCRLSRGKGKMERYADVLFWEMEERHVADHRTKATSIKVFGAEVEKKAFELHSASICTRSSSRELFVEPSKLQSKAVPQKKKIQWDYIGVRKQSLGMLSVQI
ncbi:hypothetical protein RUM43_002116 [Polyplax serrata]|uniref:Uncharacterized protein n=1 Tax=Polyplax serrata TaxID=468196 RepID=A0AAN8NSU3_POLSC